MMGILYAILIGLVLKHLAADYLLQTPWMIAGKAQLRHPGGYVHALIHAAGTLAVLSVAGITPIFALAIALGEFMLHYLIDFAKARFSEHVDPQTNPRRFYAWFGLDQTLHSLTYVGIMALVDMHLANLT